MPDVTPPLMQQHPVPVSVASRLDRRPTPNLSPRPPDYNPSVRRPSLRPPGIGFRRLVLGRQDVRRAETWGCGYRAPTPRMQYTASSFVEPLTSLFRPVLGTRRRAALPADLFPRHASFSTETPDSALEHLYAPLVLAVRSAAARWRVLQRGRLQLYVLYVAATLVVLLLWEFAWNR